MSDAGTILLVAADPAALASIASALREDGHKVPECDAHASALDDYAQHTPDLVLIATDPVGFDGLEPCRRLIAAHGEECAPIVFIATSTDPKEIAAAFNAGATDYIAKDSSIEELRARVRSHLHNFVLLKQQKAMAEQLSRANAAKNRFIGMAAHDMRNPLASIRGFAEFLMDGTMGPMPPVQLALVSIIHGTSNLMIKTLNELLDVATIEAGQLKLQLSKHSLVDLVAKSAAQMKIEARKKRTRIEVQSPPAAPVLTMDADKMKQVVDNLLSNAIKFSPAASVITVTVECDSAQASCGFTVRDQGPGISPTMREKLFKQAAGPAPAPAAEQSSAGVGLIICRNIVEAHHGTITAENLTERGCAVGVRLPLES